MKTSSRMRILTALVAAGLLCGCGGGGGGGGGGSGGGGGGGSAAVTFRAQLTDVELHDTQRDEPVDADGLPVGGPTITRN